MARKHLFEFIDQTWFPKAIRNYETDFLQFLSNKTKLFNPIASNIDQTLERLNTTTIIDLGSGGGGALLSLNEELLKNNPEIEFVLSDYFPNETAFNYTKSKTNNFRSISISVDARNVPKELVGLRTLFLTFHHFKEEDARKIIQDAVSSKAGIAIFEAQERSFPSILAMAFSWLSVLLTTPFIRPFSFGRIFFTYLLPIVPIVTVWDGIVSSLRTYSVDEMHHLIQSVDENVSFDWEIGRKKSGPGVVLFLIGVPN